MRTSTRRRTLRPSAAEPEDAVREMFDLEHHAGQNHSSSEWQFLSPELARMGEGRRTTTRTRRAASESDAARQRRLAPNA